MWKSICCFGSMVVLWLNGASSLDTRADEPEVWVKQNLPALSKVYLHLHQHPELSFQEQQTAKYVANELDKLGFEVTEKVGGHGVVGILKNGAGPQLMIRTDLDALPIREMTNLPYASKVQVANETGDQVGTMHACGHDVHMTCLIGAARYLVSQRERWSGTLMVIGQPAEERGAGARAMLDDGLYDRFGKPDFALALHCNPTLATGSVKVRSGYAMANVDSVDITMHGRGGHGAYPHTTVDPIVQAARLVMDLQSIVSREINPIEPAVVTVGSIHAGTKHNIISDECRLQLTVRSYSDEVRTHLLDAIQRKAKACAVSANAPEPDIKISEGTPSLSNDAELAERIRKVFVGKLGEPQVVEAEPVMGGEDFSHFGRSGVPSLMYFLGVVDQKRLDRYAEMKLTPPSLHSAEFYPDIDGSLTTGVVTMSSAVLDLMGK